MSAAAAAATVSIRWLASTSPSQRVIWRTPAPLFRALDQEFSFSIDIAADGENALTDRFVERETDALAIPWENERVFCNPPYGRELERWLQKAVTSAQDEGALVVMLLPARTGNRWFHRHCLPHAEIRFIQGRLNFRLGGVSSRARSRAPFDSMVVIFHPYRIGEGHIRAQPMFPGMRSV